MFIISFLPFQTAYLTLITVYSVLCTKCMYSISHKKPNPVQPPHIKNPPPPLFFPLPLPIPLQNPCRIHRIQTLSILPELLQALSEEASLCLRMAGAFHRCNAHRPQDALEQEGVVAEGGDHVEEFVDQGVLRGCFVGEGV